MEKQLFIVLKTNQYVGNFERELMAYVFGYDNCDRYAKEELELFKKEVGDEIRDEFNNVLDLYAFGRCDPEYSCYNIGSHPNNKKSFCDSIYIALNNKLPKELCKVLLNRLNNFCEYYNEKNNTDLKVVNVGYFHKEFVKEDTLSLDDDFGKF